MSKKKFPLNKGGLLKVETKERNNEDSVLARRKKEREVQGLMERDGLPWESWEADVVLNAYFDRRIEGAMDELQRSMRAVKQRPQQLAGGVAPAYSPGTRRKRRTGQPWDLGDEWALRAVTTEAAKRNGKGTATNLANITARTLEEVAERFTTRVKQLRST
jgi:hypothetical protein